ncbi:LSm family protein [Peribacillus glennii]|uniref:Uncharacterized protein n=1 Tax=Peribacillus glennii TaxID=2303991 RepID=A0A372L8H9_9BACI|nr:hypothetical protein [Peribacillus glennii]RFU61742.1 hypothetical protein D0466_16490 [Peribacillus glennii]
MKRRKRKKEGIRCPEIVAPNAPDDFCIPELCCPDCLETPKFPSPTSCLPEAETEELEERIDAANELLLDLALSNERSEEGLMRAFEGLSGQWVELKIGEEPDEEEQAEEEQADEGVTSREIGEAGLNRSPRARKAASFPGNSNTLPQEEVTTSRSTGTLLLDEPDIAEKKPVRKGVKRKNKIYIRWQKAKKRKSNRGLQEQEPSQQETASDESVILMGRVEVVGKDFVMLKDDMKEFLIPFAQIRFIKLQNRFVHRPHEPELLDIDPCLRRSITFNFGETVASSPELIRIFFKLNLSIFLLLQLRKLVKIQLKDEVFVGIVDEVSEESVGLQMENGKLREIPFRSILFMTI